MPAEALFLFGTLRHPPLYHAVAGAPLRDIPATLPGHAVTQAVEPGGATLNFPLVVARAGAHAPGSLIRPDAAARVRLDLYEQVFGYDPEPVTVDTAEGPVEALFYRTRMGLWQPGPDWSLDRWAASHGDFAAEVAAEVMALLDEAPPEAVRHRYGMLSSFVASRRRARAEAAPASVRRAPRAGDVAVERRRVPYTRFFGVEENELRFRRFDGGLSPRVNRAAFVMADAVTLLPYDPVRDRVLVVEQFRFSPFVRGDANPWTLEAIAGRVDPAETPEAAARREAVEEAALELGALHKVGQYYPSPGAVTEYLYSYVGIADLPDGANGVHGLETEAEDIRTHILPFARLMETAATGELDNGPLLLSAHWLALNRERLRAGG